MIVTHCDGKLRLKFGYNPDTVAIVKEAPDGRRYDPKTKEWVLPCTIENVRFCIDALGAEDQGMASLLQSMERPLVVSATESQTAPIDWRTTPFKHQGQGLDLLLANDKIALFWEMGTGKSLVTIKAIGFRLQAGQIKRALIVCPKTVITSWVKEFARYSDIVPEVIGGTAKQREHAARHAQVAIVNYDLLIRMDLGAAWDMVVFDESQYIKAASAKRSKAAYELAKQAKYRVLLTGTPVAKDAGDMFGQFKVLDESIFGNSFYAFRAKYFANVGRNFPDWRIRPEAADAIRSKVALRAQRIRKADVLDLPEKLYQVRRIEMTKDQARHYRELEKELLTEILTTEDRGADGKFQVKQVVTVPYLITRMMRLNQICSGYVHHEGRDLEVCGAPESNPKLAELKQIIDDYDAGDGRNQVVVWCTFLHDIKAICEVFPAAMVIDGSKSTQERQEAIDLFQAGLCKVIVLQQQAGAVGITLTAAHLSIFYSRNYSLLDRMQAEDRLHRIGQVNKVTYIDLIMADSIEEEIVEALEEKRIVAGYLQGDIESIVVERFRKKFASKSGETACR
jgi:SNF2 family DNA or RNA helicase